MARKVVNRKQLREEVEAAEAAEKAGTAPAKKKKTKRKAAKRKSRTKEAPDIRMKLFWGVYNQSMKLVARFEYADKSDAEKKLKALNDAGKSVHFMQKIKETIEE